MNSMDSHFKDSGTTAIVGTSADETGRLVMDSKATATITTTTITTTPSTSSGAGGLKKSIAAKRRLQLDASTGSMNKSAGSMNKSNDFMNKSAGSMGNKSDDSKERSTRADAVTADNAAATPAKRHTPSDLVPMKKRKFIVIEAKTEDNTSHNDEDTGTRGDDEPSSQLPSPSPPPSSSPSTSRSKLQEVAETITGYEEEERSPDNRFEDYYDTSSTTAHPGSIFHSGLDNHQHYPTNFLNYEQISLELGQVFTVVKNKKQDFDDATLSAKRAATKDTLDDLKNRLYKLKDEKGGLLRQRERSEATTKLIQMNGYINRCFLKIAEIDYLCNYELSSNLDIFVDLCAGPGGFTEYLNSKNWRTFGYAFQSPKCEIKKEKLCNVSSMRFFTGNILSERDRKIFTDSVYRVASLVVADGALDCKKRENQQEEINLCIIKAQVEVMKKCLLPGGTMLLKVFDFFLDSTKLVLYDLYNCFETMKIIKPTMSRQINAERYIVVTGFKTPDQLTVPPMADTEVIETPRFQYFSDILDEYSFKYAVKQMETLLQFDTTSSAPDPLSNDEDLYKFYYKLNCKKIPFPQSVMFTDVMTLVNTESPVVQKPTLTESKPTLYRPLPTVPSSVSLKDLIQHGTAYSGLLWRVTKKAHERIREYASKKRLFHIRPPPEETSPAPSSSKAAPAAKAASSHEERRGDQPQQKNDQHQPQNNQQQGTSARASASLLSRDWKRNAIPFQNQGVAPPPGTPLTFAEEHVVDVTKPLDEIIVPADFCIGFILAVNYNKVCVRWAPLKHMLTICERNAKNDANVRTMVQFNENFAFSGFPMPANTVMMCTFTWMNPKTIACVQIHDIKWVFNDNVSTLPFVERKKVIDEILLLYHQMPRIQDVERSHGVYPPRNENFENKVKITRRLTGSFYNCTAFIFISKV